MARRGAEKPQTRLGEVRLGWPQTESAYGSGQKHFRDDGPLGAVAAVPGGFRQAKRRGEGLQTAIERE
jgi:hypothetical protein